MELPNHKRSPKQKKLTLHDRAKLRRHLIGVSWFGSVFRVGIIAPLPATRVLFQKLSESDMLRGPLISKFLVSIIIRFPDIPMILVL